jgi:alpha-L-fucosidase
VSKNGNLLLNFPVRADGTLDAREEQILASLAEWMAVNSEAIYDTRPWKHFGEGGGAIVGGKFNEDKLQYTARDIRFTTKGGTLYAIALGWPESGELLIQSLAGANIQSVRLLQGGNGGGDTLKWTRAADGVRVKLPADKRGDHAYAFRLEGAA